MKPEGSLPHLQTHTYTTRQEKTGKDTLAPRRFEPAIQVSERSKPKCANNVSCIIIISIIKSNKMLSVVTYSWKQQIPWNFEHKAASNTWLHPPFNCVFRKKIPEYFERCNKTKNVSHDSSVVTIHYQILCPRYVSGKCRKDLRHKGRPPAWLCLFPKKKALYSGLYGN
jgi:hypothetical protein